MKIYKKISWILIVYPSIDGDLKKMVVSLLEDAKRYGLISN